MQLDQSQLIGNLVIRRRVEYFMFGDRHIHTLTDPLAFPQSAGYSRCSGAFNILFNYLIHSRDE